MDTREETTHFGYEEVETSKKAERVAAVFDSVASNYDLMNDVMSLGIHRLWKKQCQLQCDVRPGQKVLDIAGGTGDLALGFAKKVGPHGQVILSDINNNMLNEGRKRLLDAGFCDNTDFIQADAEDLPFPDNYFDLITIGFGLRNVTRKEKALESMYRIVKPGGKCVILEFSHPVLPGLKPIYDLYSFKVLPLMGKHIAKDEDSYRYLAESIRRHPDQDTLLKMMQEAGWEQARYKNLSGGIVAMHWGYKL